MKIRILFTIPNFITAGSGRAMLNIVGRIDREKYAPAVCVLRKGGALDREVEDLGFPLLEAPFAIQARPLNSLLLRVRAAAREFQPYHFHLWHSFHYSDDYTEPLIARFSGARGWIYTKKNMGWNRRSWYLRTILATRIGAQNTDMLRTFFADRALRGRVRLIPPTIDPDYYQPGVPRRLHLRERLGIPPESPLVGTVAHLVPVKGHPTLLQAVARLPEVHLLLAGKPLDLEYATLLKQMAADLDITNRVHFLGDIHDVPGLLVELDVFVLPTWARWRMEGCPVALMEAMACERACVATDIPGSRDLIEHRKTGWLVPPEDSDALASGIKRLASDRELSHFLAIAARERVVRSFSLEQEVAAYEQLYSEIVSTPTNRVWKATP